MTARLDPYASLPVEAIRWLANGHRGISSETLMSAMYGIKVGSSHRDAPHDPSDFRRCRLMVDGIPGARELLASLVDVRAGAYSRTALLKTIEHWDVLCGVMDAEVGDWKNPWGKSAPRLYDAMQLLVWREAADFVADLPQDIRGMETGVDRLDFLVGRSRLDASPTHIQSQVAELMAMPVVESAMTGRTAFALLNEARKVVQTVIDAGGPVAERAAKVLKERAFVAAPPRGARQDADARRALHACLYLLWNEGRDKKSGAAARTGYESMRRMFDAALSKSLTPAASQPSKARPR
jgi:hypothetical protein